MQQAGIKGSQSPRMLRHSLLIYRRQLNTALAADIYEIWTILYTSINTDSQPGQPERTASVIGCRFPVEDAKAILEKAELLRFSLLLSTHKDNRE